MRCPFCNNLESKVIDTRAIDDYAAIRRRRQCEKCRKRFTTYEKVETMPIMLIKKDRTREGYERAKLEKGIIQSCHKRLVARDTIQHMVDDIENTIFSMGVKEIESSVVGELVMNKLKEVDEVAYVRFASVYREFKDVGTFMEEIRNLIKNKKS